MSCLMLECLEEKVLRETRMRLLREFGTRIKSIKLEKLSGGGEETHLLKVTARRENCELATNIFEEVYKVMYIYGFHPLLFVEIKDENGRLPRKEDAEKWLGRAKQSLAAANCLYREGFWPEVLPRAYFAMSYAAKCLLGGDLYSRPGSDICDIVSLGRHAAGGNLEVHLHKNLLFALNERYRVDFEVLSEVSATEAEKALERAHEFITEVEKKLRNNGILQV